MPAKKLLIALFVAVVAAGAIFLVLPKDSNPSSADQDISNAITQNPSDGGSGEQAGLPTYTATQVAQHNNKSDCWTIINDNVYNLTSFIPGHPGDDEILRACGIDATTLFTQRETTDGHEVGSGTPHSSTAQAELAKLKIGELAN